MGWKITDKFLVDPQDNDSVPFDQGGIVRRSTWSKIKDYILGNATLATSDKTVRGAINEVNTSLSDVANQYEEGTFTPYITGATNSGTFVPVYSAQNGSFIRQNKLITFKLKVVLLSYTGAFNGNLRIAGLPFAAVSDGVNIPLSVSDLNNLDMDTNAKFATAQVMNSSSAIALLQPTDNSSGISVANTNLGQTFAITITGQYKKA
ncbi:hypothetical protein [Clostridium beijerinckii]|uniref:hypothetical protein n=1 Tax=Clostridium beijerinckii TaxID=1520 RepID=UPI001494308B|nr:hypothetical protein [Clostridium beijerinckii]NOW02428.1 hypothetical protein [Clostridium beijerinckii]NOW02484.1 hypothetical protein [Clostridium beijerinckii]NYC04373.1 hypothetical protein [Clostridium beijerinckii]NYC05607.1 hypothetical protein [Clostridium beijerinckii]